MFSGIQKEKKKLNEICKKEKEVIDIVLLRRDKEFDAAIIFKNEKYNKKTLFKVKEIFNKNKNRVNIVLLIADNLFKDIFYLKLFQEGFSIRNNKPISKLLDVETLILLTYNLKKLDHSKKTLFGYALKGRKDEKGFLGNLKGQVVGRNSILIPYDKTDEIKEFFETWKVDYSIQKFMRINEKK